MRKRASRTNSTFGFCQHEGKPKKPKELFFSHRSPRIMRIEIWK